MAKKKKTKKPPQGSAATAVRRKRSVRFFVAKHPHLIPLTILLAILLMFFNEVMFGGKTFMPPDKLNSASIRPFLDEAFVDGTYPKWNPYIFCGMPSFASLQSAPYIDLLGDVLKGASWVVSKVFPLSSFTRILTNYFLLGLFTYFLLMRISGLRLVALFAAVAFVLQPQIISFTAFGHNTKIATAVFIPLMFLLLDELLRKPRLPYFALLALAVGLQLLRAHTQIAYYAWMMMGLLILYWLIESIKNKLPRSDILKSLGAVSLSLLLGMAMSSWLYLSVQEYADYSIRGGGTGLDYIYATNWSFSPKEIVTFLVPSFMGFGGETYWGAMPFTDYPLYPGVVALFFAGLAIVLKRDRNVMFFTIMAVLALVVSFGKHLPILYGPLFEFLPFFNKFRVPNMIHILFAFAIAVLGGAGLHHLKDAPNLNVEKKVRNYIYAFGGIAAILVLFLLAGKGSYFELIKSSTKPLSAATLEIAHRNAATDGLKLAILVGLSGFLVLYYLKGRIKWQTVAFMTIALTVVDLWLVSSKIINPRPQKAEGNFFAPNHVVRFLTEDHDPFRIYPVLDDKPVNWYMYHKIQNVKGYHAAKLRIYQTFLEKTQLDSRNLYGMAPFLDKYLNISHQDGRAGVQTIGPDAIPESRLKSDYALLDMLNVKYLISNFQIPDPRFKLVVQGQPSVYENTGVLPRAYFVDRFRTVKDEAFFDYLKSGEFNPAEEAVLEETPSFFIKPSDQNQVTVTSYDIHEINLEANVAEPALMVLSEIYYPAGWKAYVDGRETEILRTNYIMRSIFLEPGKHEIRFVFKPARFTLGVWITFGVLFLLVGLLVYSWRRQKQSVESSMATT